MGASPSGADSRFPLRDGGITWIFHFRESEVPPRERAIGTWTKRNGLLRLAVTYGAPDWSLREYRSTTAVHLWRMGALPATVSWRDVFVHVFTHEPLHHAIGLALAELGERADQEWAIERLGDGRWW
ncbi:MAG TPA: hypothetical protein HA326_08960 [Thermoplasmata archaeon]|nr:hypothetical protein [Thermoplasmata archaeon]